MSSLGLLEAKTNLKQRAIIVMIVFFCGGGGGLVVGGGALLVGCGSACGYLGGFSTGDEVMLTSHPELAQCAPKTAHRCPITLNNSYNGVPPAPGTGMDQSLEWAGKSRCRC